MSHVSVKLSKLNFHIKKKDNTLNLFGADWMNLFDLWSLPVNSLSKKINMATEIFCKGVKRIFTTVFSEGHEKFTKAKANFHLQLNVIPVFKSKLRCLLQLWNTLTKNLTD